jgi:NAD(P)-dependent dehydrogenase (short-subunit alcohol dehydrogenase family)
VSLSLTGRAAIVTGASEGLGREIARACVAAGASVLFCARSGERLEPVLADLRGIAGRDLTVVAEPADVSNPSDVDRLVARALDAFPQVHILVNNAGVYGPLGPIETVDWPAWTRAIEINLYGSVLMAALVPHFKHHRYGKIGLSGGGARSAAAHRHAASKAAVVRFAESLALELEGSGIDVNSMAPRR